MQPQSHPENSFQEKGKSLFHVVSPIDIPSSPSSLSPIVTDTPPSPSSLSHIVTDTPSSPSSSVATIYSSEDDNDDDLSKQLVLYDPLANGNWEIEPVPLQHSLFSTYSSPRARRVLPSVGAFTVQCADCFKWRLIPTKQKYEAIREHILEVPFYCEVAREWRPNISCLDPEDITQDDSKLWAIDEPNIAQPPPGWQRLLRIRSEGCTKFADIYYMSPSGKRLRSMVEVRKYLIENLDYIRDGVRMSQFSFRTPKPLQENYVRKRPAPSHWVAPYDGNEGVSRPLQLTQANPISNSEVGVGDGELLSLTYGDLVWPPEKERARTTPLKRIFSNGPVYSSSHI